MRSGEISLRQARGAQDVLDVILGEHPGVNGIGITPTEDGYALKVNVRAGTAQEIPAEVEGVPVMVQIVAPVRV